MKLLGLEKVYESLTRPLHWGMQAKGTLPKQKPTTSTRKKYRKMIQASR